MLRLLRFAAAIIFLVSFVACNGGPVAPTGEQGNPNPPNGNNPGSTYYQLQAYIDLSKNEGDAPMPVNMTAVVKGGKEPYTYKWDIDGDGHFDYIGPNYSEIGINYASVGTYDITLEVDDSNDQSFQAHNQVYVRPSGPIAVASAQPAEGNAPLTVTLNGAASHDLDGFVVKYEWDFTSDGVYDYTSTTSGVTTAQYTQVGTYNATLRVTDDDGLIDVSSVQIIVE